MVAVPAQVLPTRTGPACSEPLRRTLRKPDLREENRYEGPEKPRVWAAPPHWYE